jgi:hypothetical protein
MKDFNKMVPREELAERFANLRVLPPRLGAPPQHLGTEAWFVLERRCRC